MKITKFDGKCKNCGTYFYLTDDWSDTEICSEKCFKEYVDYLNDEKMKNKKTYCKNSDRLEDCSKCNNAGCERYERY
jgi:hypothetical protein